jgi:hypothetical protein
MNGKQFPKWTAAISATDGENLEYKCVRVRACKLMHSQLKSQSVFLPSALDPAAAKPAEVTNS